MEFPDMPPISDDELQSMEDMELLRSQLRNVGDPVDATFAKLFVRSLEDKSLGVRKWQHRKSQFEKLLQIANSRNPGHLPILKLQLWSTQSKIVATKFRRMQKRWHAS
jgi:hypothetical protein